MQDHHITKRKTVFLSLPWFTVPLRLVMFFLRLSFCWLLPPAVWLGSFGHFYRGKDYFFGPGVVCLFAAFLFFYALVVVHHLCTIMALHCYLCVTGSASVDGLLDSPSSLVSLTFLGLSAVSLNLASLLSTLGPMMFANTWLWLPSSLTCLKLKFGLRGFGI